MCVFIKINYCRNYDTIYEIINKKHTYKYKIYVLYIYC